MRSILALLIGVALGYGFRGVIHRKLAELRHWVLTRIFGKVRNE